jgi:hypothetical protein
MAAARWLLPPPGGERHDLCLADHRHRLEVEAGERFADGQSCFGQVTLDAAAAAPTQAQGPSLTL